ncbi:MAG: GspC family type II secretion system variant ExeC [Gammaproteobacteria bacterium]
MPITITPALNQRAVKAALLLATLLVAAAAADLTWTILKPDPVNPLSHNGAASPAAPPSARSNKTSDGERLATLHLFGIAQSATQAAIKAVEAPDTKLRLTLKGVLAHEDPRQARAIIANAGGEEESYAVGKEITGGAVLREVKADRVILERTGRYETLRLPEKSTGGLSVAVQQASRQSAAPAPSGALANISDLSLREIRQALVDNPALLPQYLRAVPVQQGDDFKGFRIMAGSRTHLLDKLGFRRGDIVTEVNGIALDNQLKGLEALTAITEADSTIQVTVLRDGKPQVLTFSLD